jgi:hypothetical protein
MMIVTGGATKTLNERRNLYLSSLLIIFGLVACSDTEPTETSTVTPMAQQSSQLDVDQPSGLGLTTVVPNEGSSEPSGMVASTAASDLDQSILKSLSKFSKM